jgi:hypothetical protein
VGRRPEPKSDKIARGTYRPDRDKSMTVALAGEDPEMPEGLGDAGRQFWAEAYAVPWVTASNRTMVLLIARKLDERETIASQYYQTPADQWRQQRTLKDIDRDIVAGLEQLLLTPNSQKKAGIEIADPEKDVLSPLELMMALKHGDITPEEYERQKNLRNSAGV